MWRARHVCAINAQVNKKIEIFFKHIICNPKRSDNVQIEKYPQIEINENIALKPKKKLNLILTTRKIIL